jgi:hypothetical protein
MDVKFSSVIDHGSQIIHRSFAFQTKYIKVTTPWSQSSFQLNNPTIVDNGQDNAKKVSINFTIASHIARWIVLEIFLLLVQTQVIQVPDAQVLLRKSR